MTKANSLNEVIPKVKVGGSGGMPGIFPALELILTQVVFMLSVALS